MDEFVVDLDKVLDDFEETLGKETTLEKDVPANSSSHNGKKENEKTPEINKQDDDGWGEQSTPPSQQPSASNSTQLPHETFLVTKPIEEIFYTAPDAQHPIPFRAAENIDLDRLLDTFEDGLHEPVVDIDVQNGQHEHTEDSPTLSGYGVVSPPQTEGLGKVETISSLQPSPPKTASSVLLALDHVEVVPSDHVENPPCIPAISPNEQPTLHASPEEDQVVNNSPFADNQPCPFPSAHSNFLEPSFLESGHDPQEEDRPPPSYEDTLLLSQTHQTPLTPILHNGMEHPPPGALQRPTSIASESSHASDPYVMPAALSEAIQSHTTDFYRINFEDSLESSVEAASSSGAEVLASSGTSGALPEPSPPPIRSPAAAARARAVSAPVGQSTEVETAPTLHTPVCAWFGGLTEAQIGLVEPQWAPDNSSAVCMVCALKFTVIRRRHHCRACGQLLCSTCCNWWMPLTFLDHAKARVCASCYQLLVRLESSSLRAQDSVVIVASSATSGSGSSGGNLSGATVPVSALKRSRASSVLAANAPSSSVMTGNSGENVLPKCVCFADGVRPGRDLNETASVSEVRKSPPAPLPRSSLLAATQGGMKERSRESNVSVTAASKPRPDTVETCFLPNWNDEALRGVQNLQNPMPLPPLVEMLPDAGFTGRVSIVRKGLEDGFWKGAGPFVVGMKFQMVPDLTSVVQRLSTCNVGRCVHEVRFAVSPQCHVRVSRWRLCDVEQDPIAWKNADASIFCWRFISHGMQSAGQQEVALLLECSPEEILPPMAIMRLFYQFFVYVKRTDVTGHPSPLHEFACYIPASVSGGSAVDRLPFPCGAGVLCVTLRHLTLPIVGGTTSMLGELPSDCILGLLIHHSELVWARLLPQRLLYRMGMAAQCYPHPLVSQRHRASLFGDVGHTLFRLLADFNTFRYTVNTVAGLTISLFPDGLFRIQIPKSSYNQVLRVLNERSDDSSVLAFGAVFNMAADSHLTCVQNADTDQYSTEAILAATATSPKLTGASFVVFNGGQRVSSGSLVEDGVLVQMSQGQFQELLASLTEMREFSMSCPSTTSGASPHVSPLRKVTLIEAHNNTGRMAGKSTGVQPQQGLLQVHWLDELEETQLQVSLWRSSCVDGRRLRVDQGYAGLTFGHMGCGPFQEGCYRVPTECQLRYTLRAMASAASSHGGEVDFDELGRNSALGAFGVAFVRLFVLQCPPECEDAMTRDTVDPLHLCEPVVEAFVRFLLPFAEVAHSMQVRGVSLRATLDPELVGYSLGCCDWCDARLPHGLPECCTLDGALDDALIPVLHTQAARVRNGPLEIEMSFYLVPLTHTNDNA